MILVFTAVPTNSVARRMAQALVQERVAACVTILPNAQSIYRWKNKIEKTAECLLLIKSTPAAFVKLKRQIQKLHPYEVPEIVCFKSTGILSNYAAWMKSCVEAS